MIGLAVLLFGLLAIAVVLGVIVVLFRRPRAFTLRFLMNFGQWSRLENWARVATLAFGVLAGVAAFGAVNFLAKAPDLRWTYFCADNIIADELREFFRDEEKRLPPRLIQLSARHTGEARFIEPNLPEYAPLECLDQVTYDQAIDAADAKASGRDYPAVPKFLLELLRDTDPGPRWQLATEALQSSRAMTVTISVVNVGEVATDAELQGPPEYTRDKKWTLRLAPGEGDEMVLVGLPGGEPPRQDQFNVDWPKEGVVDPDSLKLWAAGLLILVLVLVVYDIAGPRAGWREEVD